jgi:hypothetical protein
MSIRTLVAVAAVLLGAYANQAYAQAGSGASAPATITAPTPSGDTARNPIVGDPGKPRVRPRRARTRPVPSTQNGNTPDRASAAGGGR